MFKLLQAFAPTVAGSIADGIGRRTVYILCFLIYMASHIALALQRAFPAVIILRAVQSSGSSPTVALAKLTRFIGDISLEKIVGTKPSVLVGCVATDYTDFSTRDPESVPRDVEARANPASKVETQNNPFSIFTHDQKLGIVMTAATAAFFSPLTASACLPALPAIAKEFGVSYSSIHLTVTSYMVSPPTTL